MSYKNEAYEKALREGLFSTERLPQFMRVEIERYETAIVNLLRAADALAYPMFSDANFATTQRDFAEESVNEIVCAVRDLHESRRIENGLVAFVRHDALRGLETVG